VGNFLAKVRVFISYGLGEVELTVYAFQSLYILHTPHARNVLHALHLLCTFHSTLKAKCKPKASLTGSILFVTVVGRKNIITVREILLRGCSLHGNWFDILSLNIVADRVR
jgi:hypothetical protein